jgi:hypothetical protein
MLKPMMQGFYDITIVMSEVHLIKIFQTTEGVHIFMLERYIIWEVFFRCSSSERFCVFMNLRGQR